jgi:hypothetical protein
MHVLLAAAAVTIRVLFIGNSLTAANGLPAMLEALARGAGEHIESRTVAFPDYSLEDHWNRGDAARAIATGGWSVVVLQQGPSALPESRLLLNDYVKRFDARARAVGAKTATYMVWPSTQRTSDFEAVSRSYSGAAALVHGLVLPVGDAWRAAWRHDSHLALYGNDGLHPSPMGTYVAALVMYQQLTGRSPIGLPRTLESPSGVFPAIVLPADQAALLQRAADEANARFRSPSR